MKHFLRWRLAFASVMAALVSACGGGPEPVTSVASPDLRYTGSTGVVTLNLSGNALDNGIKVYANETACIVGTTTTASARSATCILTVPDNLKLPVRVTSASDYTVFSTTLDVPAPQVTLSTSMGTVVLELNPSAAPISVTNFLAYVNRNPSFYVGTIFHRVDPSINYVVQAGGFTSGMVVKTGQSPAIALESNNGLKNLKYTLGMARTAASESATSQFYVNLRDNTGFDYVSQSFPGYAVFGRVVSGTEVIDLISAQPTTTVNGAANVPVTDITITAASQTQ